MLRIIALLLPAILMRKWSVRVIVQRVQLQGSSSIGLYLGQEGLLLLDGLVNCLLI